MRVADWMTPDPVTIAPGATASGHYRRVYRDQAFVERLIRAFRAAGLPD